jgi:hypothetical protein
VVLQPPGVLDKQTQHNINQKQTTPATNTHIHNKQPQTHTQTHNQTQWQTQTQSTTTNETNQTKQVASTNTKHVKRHTLEQRQLQPKSANRIQNKQDTSTTKSKHHITKQ